MFEEDYFIFEWMAGDAPTVSSHINVYFTDSMQAGPGENLKDVALKILQNGVAAVPIIHSSPEDGSYPQLLHLTSLSEILKCKFFLIWILSGLNNELK